MIIVIARLVIKPGSIPHLREPARICVAETRKEEGCIAYDLFESVTEPDTLVFVELWETREALSRHARTPHIAAWRKAGKPHVIERRIEIVTPENIETHIV